MQSRKDDDGEPLEKAWNVLNQDTMVNLPKANVPFVEKETQAVRGR